jgi:hypothetical protein
MTLVTRCAHGHKRYSSDDNVVLGELAPPVMVCRALWRLMYELPGPGGGRFHTGDCSRANVAAYWLNERAFGAGECNRHDVTQRLLVAEALVTSPETRVL